MFRALNIDFDGQVFEKYFRAALYDSAIPMDGAMELLEALHGKYPLAVASNGRNYYTEFAQMVPKDCVIIGDSLTSDMAGGRQYGMKTCYYRRPGAAEGTDVTWQVTDLRQIPALLEGTA